MKHLGRGLLAALLILALIVLPVCATSAVTEEAVYEARLDVIRANYEAQLKEAASVQTILSRYWWALVVSALLGSLVTALIATRINAAKIGKIKLDALNENTKLKQQYSLELSRLRQQQNSRRIHSL